MHDGGADLQACCAQKQKLRGILPSGDSAHAGDRQPGRANDFIRAKRGKHVQRDWFYRRTGVAAMSAFASDVGRDFERVQVDADNRIQRVDQRERIGSGRDGRARGLTIFVMFGVKLDDDGNLARTSMTQRSDLLAVFRHLAHGGAHAALAHAVRAAIVRVRSHRHRYLRSGG